MNYISVYIKKIEFQAGEVAQPLKARLTMRKQKFTEQQGSTWHDSPPPPPMRRWNSRNLEAVAWALGLSLIISTSITPAFLHHRPGLEGLFLYRAPPPTFQFSCIFILTASFSCVGEFSSGFCLWGSMHSQRYLAHLHDGIFRAASPILRDWGSLHCGWDEWEMSRCTPVYFLFRTTSPPNHKLAFIKMWHLSFQSEFIFLWCE